MFGLGRLRCSMCGAHHCIVCSARRYSVRLHGCTSLLSISFSPTPLPSLSYALLPATLSPSLFSLVSDRSTCSSGHSGGTFQSLKCGGPALIQTSRNLPSPPRQATIVGQKIVTRPLWLSGEGRHLSFYGEFESADRFSGRS